MKKGFSLIEVLVGVFLALIVFLAVFGGYQLILKVLSQNRSRVAATSIVNAEIEKIRNLPYGDIGVVDSYPDGILEEETVKTLNGRDYTVSRRVDFFVDDADGIESPEDECPNDYKKVEIRVSWLSPFEGEVKVVSNIAPENMVQECGEVGGIVSVSVFDAQGIMVENPLIEVKDPETEEIIKTATPTDGKHFFSLPAQDYRVEVSKEEYSSSRTYSIEEVAIPEKPNPSAIEGKMVETSFSIDELGSLSINTLSPWSSDNFSDSFVTDGHISASSTIDVSEGKVEIASDHTSGYLVSEGINPSLITSWEELSWNDEEIADTEIVYQLLYFNGESWVLVPDSVLPGNSSGFSVSPIDLSGLSSSIYSQLKIKGELSSSDISVSPSLFDWHLSWRTSEPVPIPNVDFNLRGSKVIGKDSEEDPIYKYSQTHNSGGSGSIYLSNMEWDLYTFTIYSGLDLLETNPSPVSLAPDENLSVNLFLEAQNSLMVKVQDQDTGDPVFSAEVKLLKTGYDNAQNTDQEGRTYFIPLDSGTYSIEVSAPGFSDYSGSVSVSGDQSKIINLERVE